MNTVKFKKEESDTNRYDIARAESHWDKNFPKDYVEFLLKYNGAISYPRWPNLGPENKTEIWDVERFLSVGDLIIQKQYPMTYTLNNIHEENFEEHGINPDDILIFALASRGLYFFNLADDDYGRIYIANFSGGDGISKTCTNSFTTFINSLEIGEWSDEVFNPNYQFTDIYHSGIKVLQTYMFHTPNEPELGFQRFVDVFEFSGNILPSEDGYPSIIQKYVDDRLKLEYLIGKGCSTDGLLNSTKRAETIQYLVTELNLDINKKYKNRYPLQNYLSEGYSAQFAYEELHKLLEMKLEIDWSIKGKLYNGDDDLPMIDKLRILHEKYLKLKEEEEEFQKEYHRPSGRPPFIESRLIEEKLGIANSDKWVDRILDRITRSNNK